MDPQPIGELPLRQTADDAKRDENFAQRFEICELLFIAPAKALVRLDFFFQLFVKRHEWGHSPAGLRLRHGQPAELVSLRLQMTRSLDQATSGLLVLCICSNHYVTSQV
jgi:hypothetical protein